MTGSRLARTLAVVLGAGWVLLSLPDDAPITTGLSGWEREGAHGTAYECEQARREAVAERRAEGGRPGREAEQRHRCERVERLPGD